MKSPRIKILATLVFVALLAASSAFAQQPRVGLALSGGAARGFAHIGVLKVLEEVDMPVSIIVGVSMGAVVGGLFSCGYTATELESLAVSVDWLHIVSQEASRRSMSMVKKQFDARYLATMGLDGWKVRLPSGLRSGQELMTFYTRLTVDYQDDDDFDDLPIPFACVAQDLVTGEAVRLDHGSLTDAVRASMAIPWVMSPIVIDDRLLTDGGGVRNLPAQDAREMGADIVIGVDVGPTTRDRENLNTMFDVLRQETVLDLQKETREQYAYCNMIIIPDLTTVSVSDFGKAADAIALGEQAARAMLPQLRSLADSLNAITGPPPLVVRPNVPTFYLEQMTVTGLNRVSRRMIDVSMGISFPDTVDVRKIERGVDHVYGSGFFDRVTYRVTGNPDRATLQLSVVEQSQDLFRFGFRYDTRTEASLLLNATFRNLLTSGSTLALDVRLAEDMEAEIRHTIHLGILPSLGTLTRLNASRISTNTFEDNVQVAEYRSSYAYGELVLGTIFSSTATFGVGLRVEYVDSKPTIGSPTFEQQIVRGMPVIAGLIVDTTDELLYPTSGMQMDLRFEHTFADVGNTGEFSRIYIDAGLVAPIRSKLGALLDIYVGASEGEVPFAYQFAMGGIHAPWTFLGFDNSFMGVKAQQRVGPFMQAVNLGLQYQLITAVFAQLRWSIGNTFDDSDIKLETGRYINGLGATLGARVLKGRAEVTFSTSEIEDFLVHVTIGSAF